MTENSFPTLPRAFARGALALAVALVSAAALATPVQAQAEGEDRGPWSIGLQGGLPVSGLSVRYDMSDKLTSQAVLGGGPGLLGLSGRLNYRFQEEEKYAVFGFGALGFYQYAASGGFAAESSVGFGGGGGVELDWPAIIEDSEFPPLYSTIELGYTFASFDNYTWGGLSLQGSLHWRL